MKPIIKIQNLSKMYRLGVIGTGTLSHDLNRWWHKVRGMEDPYLKIGEANVSDHKSTSDYVWALKDINLEVMPGEVLGIIGKNGAGKSTLLKILSRVTGPTTGSISYRGRIGSLLEVGTGFHPELTGRENIFLNGAILGMTKAEIRKKLDEIVDFAGVERYIDTPVKRYSSGMKVRLGFAVAAHLEPEILVVDEVLAVGDAEFQKKAVGKMQDVSTQDGRTILFVSHNMAAIENLCTRLIVLKDGKIDFNGDVNQGVNHYLKGSIKHINNSLNERKNRIGGEIFRFTALKAYSGGDNNMAAPQTAKELTIKLNYSLKKELKNIIIRIIVVSQEEVVKFVCNNYHSAKPFDLIKNDGYFVCKIPKLPLLAGTYYMHIQCLSNKEIVDEVEYAAELNVTEGDFFGTGKIPAINSVLIPHEIKYFNNSGKK